MICPWSGYLTWPRGGSLGSGCLGWRRRGLLPPTWPLKTQGRPKRDAPPAPLQQTEGLHCAQSSWSTRQHKMIKEEVKQIIQNPILHQALHKRQYFCLNNLKLYIVLYIYPIYMRPWATKPVLSHWGIFVAIAKNTWYVNFSFMLNIISILSKDHVPWRYLVHF